MTEKIGSEVILKVNRLQLIKQDLYKTQMTFLNKDFHSEEASSSKSRKECMPANFCNGKGKTNFKNIWCKNIKSL